MVVIHKLKRAATRKSDGIVENGYIYEKSHFLNTSSFMFGLGTYHTALVYANNLLTIRAILFTHTLPSVQFDFFVKIK